MNDFVVFERTVLRVLGYREECDAELTMRVVNGVADIRQTIIDMEQENAIRT